MKLLKLLTIILLIPITMISCQSTDQKQEQELQVFCGAGLTDLVERIAADYEAETGQKILLNFASSGFLARQLISGAESDVYISANARWMEKCVEEGLVNSKDVFPFTRTALVLVVSEKWQEEIHQLKDLAKFPEIRLAIGDPAHVPAGEYAREAMQKAGIWEELQGNLIPALDVRAAFMYVEKGEADAALVYQSDSTSCEKSKLALIISQKLHQPILFLASPLKGKESDTINSFVKYLQEIESSLFEEYGFRRP